MSTPGHIYRERIDIYTPSGAGSQSCNYTIENDGALVTIDKDNVTRDDIFVEIYSVHPGEIEDIKLDSFTVGQNSPVQKAYICGHILKVYVSYSVASDYKVAVKTISGAAVSAFQKQSEVLVNLATKDQMDALLSRFDDSLELQQALLNHLRQITDIESCTGEIY